jgi:predicted transcriptional regulator
MKYIPLKHVYPKDIRCMSILAKSGAMDRDTFHKIEITDNRIKSYLHAGMIKEISVIDKNGNGFKTYYELDKKGKEFCRQECNIKHFISNANASIHNAKVSEYLVNNLSKKELDTCLSERELQPFIEDRLQEYLDKQEQDHYQELVDALQNNQLSMPDIIYKTEQGTWEAIEITTDSYGNEEIESKTMTCEFLSVEVTFVHT